MVVIIVLAAPAAIHPVGVITRGSDHAMINGLQEAAIAP